MTSLTPLLLRHKLLNYDDTNPSTITSLTPLLGMGVLVSASNGGHLDMVDLLVSITPSEYMEQTDEGFKI